MRLAGVLSVILGAAVAWLVIAELAWVDHRPVCSGLAMRLRPDIAGECFTGPRPILVDGAAPPAVIAIAAFVAIVVLVWVSRRRRPA